jgi:thiazole/oxazole-forming peptide maturase SagD family component
MREYTAKIGHLDDLKLDHVERLTVIGDVSVLDIRTRLRLFLFRLLFNTQSAIVYIFSLRRELFKERVLLSVLKQKGIIESYGEGAVYCDYPRINFFGVLSRVTGGKKNLHSWGYTLPTEKKEFAMKKAIWETFERDATYHTHTRPRTEYPKFMCGDASHLYNHLPRFTGEQTERDSTLVSSPDDLKSVTGLYARSITGDRPRFLPADCFYWGERVAPEEKLIHDPTTNGSGGGATLDQAVCSGLYELIERDTFLLTWFTQTGAAFIDVCDEEGSLFAHVRDARERFRLEVYFLKTTYDVPVPSCVCVIIDPILNIIALGGKASGDAYITLEGAYLEALATLNLVRSRGERVDESVLKKLLDKPIWGHPHVDKKMRVNLYNSPLGVATLKKIYLDRVTTTIPYAQFKELSRVYTDKRREFEALALSMKTLVREKGEGHHVYVHEFKRPRLRGEEYYVAHVFVPAFLKLHLNERFATPISPRVIAYARAHSREISDESGLNVMPHPFP